MSYIEGLRRLVGTVPLILPGTSVVVVDERQRVLLVERTGIVGWGLPGGFMDPGESFEEAGRREVLEETGLVIGELELLGVFSGKEYFFQYPHGDQVWNVTAAFVARVGGAGVTADGDETRTARFFAPENIPDDIIAPEKPIVAAYLQAQRSAAKPF